MFFENDNYLLYLSLIFFLEIRYIIFMVISIDEKILNWKKIPQEEIKLDLALGLFIDFKVTLAQAAAISGMSQGRFMEELAGRKIPLHYDINDYNDDLNVIKELESE